MTNKIAVELNTKKYETLKIFVDKRQDVEWNAVSEQLQLTAQEAFDKAFDKLFRKYVPKAVREFIQETDK
ncbi:MAG: hypothetical protein IJM32_04120 [Ruminococcus sp.]|nr:hypothetical protein [Ruminococcus sp.]